ncbi:MAG: LysM peptidoglycan-binding domain-containing protein [Candidatus Promineifilaceae bacterium]
MIGRFLRGPARGFLVLVLILILSQAEQSTADAQSDPAAAIFQLINEYRSSLGLPPFQYNGALASAALGHASWMAANTSYTHYGAGGSSPQSRATAAGYPGYVVENIVGGTNMTPNQGLIWWQNSPIHLNTLVSSRYYEAGTGFATNGTQNMYVLVVGRQSENAPALANRPNTTNPQALVITPVEVAEPREDGSIVHELKQGQALWTLAAYYDVELDYLYLINNLTTSDVLQPGMEIKIQLADGESPPPAPTPPFTYRVKEGDSPWAIAGRFDITIDEFFYLNALNPDSTLNPGDEVIIRLAEGQAPPPTPTPRLTHRVQEGDSLWSIAANNNLTVDQLLQLNGLSADALIRPGDELKIRQPAATPVPTSTPAPPAPSRAVAEAIADNSQATPITLMVNTPDQLPEPGPSPTQALAAQNQNSGRSSTNWLLITAVALALAGGAALLIARQQQS